jgi:hypothetical protein
MIELLVQTRTRSGRFLANRQTTAEPPPTNRQEAPRGQRFHRRRTFCGWRPDGSTDCQVPLRPTRLLCTRSRKGPFIPRCQRFFCSAQGAAHSRHCAECRGQPAACPGEPRHHSADRDFSRLGNLAVIKALDVTQHQRFPERGRQRCNSGGGVPFAASATHSSYVVTGAAVGNVDVRLSPSGSRKNSKSHRSVWPGVFKPSR